MSQPGQRLPCRTCPWRRSIAPGAFPGGCLDSARLQAMSSGVYRGVMQCHSTPDKKPEVCVGFALVVGTQSFGLRLALIWERVSLKDVATDEALHSLESVIATHGDHRLASDWEDPCATGEDQERGIPPSSDWEY